NGIISPDRSGILDEALAEGQIQRRAGRHIYQQPNDRSKKRKRKLHLNTI
ncbi:MAG: hypothetical protein RLZZ500_436, partial [Bacteroidota bacterium]